MSTIKLNDCEHSIDASDANLGESQFRDVCLTESRFSKVSLEASSFEDVHMDSCVFENVSFAGVKVVNGKYEGMTIDGFDVDTMLLAIRQQQVERSGA